MSISNCGRKRGSWGLALGNWWRTFKALCFTSRPDGVVLLLGGLFEYDRDWRNRDLLSEVDLWKERLTAQTRAEMLAAEPCETAIEYVGGLPGGGKSMYATKLIVDELIHGHRPIITNCALRIGKTQEYLKQIGVNVNVAERVYLLERDEVKEFYLRRNHDLMLPLPPAGEIYMDWTPSQNDNQSAGGCFIVIDECHNYFHPHAFEKVKMTPEHPLFQWASQHRKLKDKCIFVTQSIENVHVSVRRLGQQFHYIRNLRKETFRGFRRGDGFERTTYLRQNKTGSEVAIDVDKFKLDTRGLASCYDTAGGVGIASKGVADGGFKKKGLNLKWIYVFGAACVLAVVAVMLVLPKLAANKIIDSTLGAGAAKAAVVSKGSHELGTHGAVVDGSLGSPAMRVHAVPRNIVSGVIHRGNQLLVAVMGEPWSVVVGRVDEETVLLDNGLTVSRRDVLKGGGGRNWGEFLLGHVVGGAKERCARSVIGSDAKVLVCVLVLLGAAYFWPQSRPVDLHHATLGRFRKEGGLGTGDGHANVIYRHK